MTKRGKKERHLPPKKPIVKTLLFDPGGSPLIWLPPPRPRAPDAPPARRSKRKEAKVLEQHPPSPSIRSRAFLTPGITKTGTSLVIRLTKPRKWVSDDHQEAKKSYEVALSVFSKRASPNQLRPPETCVRGRKSFGWVGYPSPSGWLQTGWLLDQSNTATSGLQCAQVLKWLRITALPL